MPGRAGESDRTFSATGWKSKETKPLPVTCQWCLRGPVFRLRRKWAHYNFKNERPFWLAKRANQAASPHLVREQVTATKKLKQKKPPLLSQRGPFLFKCLAVTYSRIGTPTLPSAMHRFTAEFGMGSGGSNALLPPGKLAEDGVGDPFFTGTGSKTHSLHLVVLSKACV